MVYVGAGGPPGGAALAVPGAVTEMVSVARLSSSPVGSGAQPAATASGGETSRGSWLMRFTVCLLDDTSLVATGQRASVVQASRRVAMVVVVASTVALESPIRGQPRS